MAMTYRNRQRINKAQRCLSHYSRELQRETQASAAVIDLLTDLQHACAPLGVDFEDCLRIARDHHALERQVRS